MDGVRKCLPDSRIARQSWWNARLIKEWSQSYPTLRTSIVRFQMIRSIMSCLSALGVPLSVRVDMCRKGSMQDASVEGLPTRKPAPWLLPYLVSISNMLNQNPILADLGDGQTEWRS